MIAIVDTGGANLSSVRYALERAGRESCITTQVDVIIGASHVILPGVGAATDAMERIKRHGLVETIQGLKQPVLGICLGMQLLFEASEEGDAKCLGILPGRVSRIPAREKLSVPHMGWNEVVPFGKAHPLFSEMEKPSLFYFVHSYAAPLGSWVTATFDHGAEYPAAVAKDNFFGVQFHPERSAQIGAKLLANFLNL